MPRLGSRVRAPLSAPLHFRIVSSGPFPAKWPSGKAEACKAFTPGSNPGFASRQHPGAPAPVLFYICGHGSVGRAQPCQGWGRGFEPRCPLQTQQPDYYGSRAFSYPSLGLEPERERALSKRGAFVASWRGRRQAAEAGADPQSGYADAPLSAPTILRGSNEPRFLLTLREPRAPHLAPQSSVAYIKYASLLFRGNLGHPEPARCRGRGSGPSVLFTNRSIRPRRLEPERERALSKRRAFVASWRGRRQAAEAGADPRSGYADAPLSAPTILRGSNEPRFLFKTLVCCPRSGQL